MWYVQNLGVARIFDWSKPKPKITCHDVIKIFKKRDFFMELRHRQMEDQKSGLARN